jgi:hypothetical protein
MAATVLSLRAVGVCVRERGRERDRHKWKRSAGMGAFSVEKGQKHKQYISFLLQQLPRCSDHVRHTLSLFCESKPLKIETLKK